MAVVSARLQGAKAARLKLVFVTQLSCLCKKAINPPSIRSANRLFPPAVLTNCPCPHARSRTPPVDAEAILGISGALFS